MVHTLSAIIEVAADLFGPYRRLGPCAQGVTVKKGLFPFIALGCVFACDRDKGATKLMFDHSPDALQ